MHLLSEKDQKIDTRLRETLQSYPRIFLMYYESLIDDGKSFSTAQIYIRNLLRFFKSIFLFPFAEDFYTSVSSKMIQDYLDSANGSDIDAINHTNAGKWSALNSFFSFLVPNYLVSNPVDAVPRPEITKEMDPTYLTKAELDRVFFNANQKARPMLRNRDLAILMLGFYRGFSNSEIVSLNINNLDLEHNLIFIKKDNKSVQIPINQKISEQLSLWLSDREAFFSSSSSNALFLSSLRTRISQDALVALVSKYEDGIDKHITPQTMRNTCVINLYMQTGDIGLCSKYLRHKTIDVTKRYIEKLTSVSCSTVEEASTVLDSFYQSSGDLSPLNKSDSFNRVKCDLLRLIRKEIAEINSIDFPMPACKYNAFCTGNCELSNSEIQYLDSMLNQKLAKGQKVSIASLSLSSSPIIQEWIQQHALVHNNATQLSLFDTDDEIVSRSNFP